MLMDHKTVVTHNSCILLCFFDGSAQKMHDGLQAAIRSAEIFLAKKVSFSKVVEARKQLLNQNGMWHEAFS